VVGRCCFTKHIRRSNIGNVIIIIQMCTSNNERIVKKNDALLRNKCCADPKSSPVFFFAGARCYGCVESQEVYPKNVHTDALIRGNFSRRFYMVGYVRFTSLLFIPPCFQVLLCRYFSICCCRQVVQKVHTKD